MSSAETHDLAKSDPQRFAAVEHEAKFHLAYLLDGKRASFSVEVLVYVIAMFFLRIKPVPGTTKLEAFDLYMAAARKTLEDNLEGGQ